MHARPAKRFFIIFRPYNPLSYRLVAVVVISFSPVFFDYFPHRQTTACVFHTHTHTVSVPNVYLAHARAPPNRPRIARVPRKSYRSDGTTVQLTSGQRQFREKLTGIKEESNEDIENGKTRVHAATDPVDTVSYSRGGEYGCGNMERGTIPDQSDGPRVSKRRRGAVR